MAYFRVLLLITTIALTGSSCFAPVNEDLAYTRFRIPADAPRKTPIFMKLGRHEVCVPSAVTGPGEHCRVYPVTKAGARNAVLKHKNEHRANRSMHWYISAYRVERTMRCEATCMSHY